MNPLPSTASLVRQLHALGVIVPDGPVRVDGFGDSPTLSESLLALIRQGAKRAGTGLLWGYEADNETIPATGDIEIVVDHRHLPAFVTRLTNVSIVPFCEVTAEYAAIEGEGDGSLQYWRTGHWEFFTRECRRIGRAPSQTMPVICSIFEVLGTVPGERAT